MCVCLRFLRHEKKNKNTVISFHWGGDATFEPHQCQINMAGGRGRWGGDAMPDPGYFCFPPNTGGVAACHSSCQNLWETLFTSSCSCALNNNSRIRQSETPEERGEKGDLPAWQAMHWHACNWHENTHCSVCVCGAHYHTELTLCKSLKTTNTVRL